VDRALLREEKLKHWPRSIRSPEKYPARASGELRAASPTPKRSAAVPAFLIVASTILPTSIAVTALDIADEAIKAAPSAALAHARRRSDRPLLGQ